MVCLVGAEEVPRPGFFRRLQGAAARREGFGTDETVILGVRMKRVTIKTYAGITQKEAGRRLALAAEELRLARAHRVIFAKNFPYREHILREGFEEAESGLVTEALAGRLAAQAADGGRTAALFAERLTGPAFGTLCELCASFRFVTAWTEWSGGRTLEELRRRTGISVLENPPISELQNADAAVFFAPPRLPAVLPEKCVAVEAVAGALEGVLYYRAVSGLTPGLKGGRETELPDCYPAAQLISSALSAGTVKTGDLEIRDYSAAGTSANIRTLDKNTSIYYNKCSYRVQAEHGRTAAANNRGTDIF